MSIFPTPGQLILGASADGTGGTSLGTIGVAHQAGFSYETNFYTGWQTGGQFTDADITALNLIYKVILLEQSQAVMGLLLQEAGTNFEFFQNYKLGHLVSTSNLLKRLVVRPDSAGPHLIIDKGLIFDVGPFIWDKRQNHFDSAYLMIAALWDEQEERAYRYGTLPTPPPSN
jgi:hypothetical protein